MTADIFPADKIPIGAIFTHDGETMYERVEDDDRWGSPSATTCCREVETGRMGGVSRGNCYARDRETFEAYRVPMKLAGWVVRYNNRLAVDLPVLEEWDH